VIRDVLRKHMTFKFVALICVDVYRHLSPESKSTAISFYKEFKFGKKIVKIKEF